MSITILGVRVRKTSVTEVTRICQEWLNGNSSDTHQIVTVNPEFVMEARRNREFLHILNSSDLAIADGIGLFFASWLLYGWKKRLHRITGVDLTWILAELCCKNSKKIYLLGARDGVAAKAAEKMVVKFPGLQVVGAEEGIPYICTQGSELFYSEICTRITLSGADVLLVAFGAPKQDEWIANHAHLLPHVRIAVGVGGTFDYIAGVVPYAPQWIRNIGFEWTYRLMTQPHRWRRIVTAVIAFPVAVFKTKFFDRQKI